MISLIDKFIYFSILILMLSCPTFLPTVMPGVLASRMKPVKALPADILGSELVRARTKYQFATEPLVIHILEPFRMYSSPFFSALVLIPATSEPAPGSVTQYALKKKTM